LANRQTAIEIIGSAIFMFLACEGRCFEVLFDLGRGSLKGIDWRKVGTGKDVRWVTNTSHFWQNWPPGKA
jgi:hypothetical protein